MEIRLYAFHTYMWINICLGTKTAFGLSKDSKPKKHLKSWDMEKSKMKRTNECGRKRYTT
jgi:hypothetical protein